eukprot:2241959-Alexandrium_andersonii.AAC.1
MNVIAITAKLSLLVLNFAILLQPPEGSVPCPRWGRSTTGAGRCGWGTSLPRPLGNKRRSSSLAMATPSSRMGRPGRDPPTWAPRSSWSSRPRSRPWRA